MKSRPRQIDGMKVVYRHGAPALLLALFAIIVAGTCALFCFFPILTVYDVSATPYSTTALDIWKLFCFWMPDILNSNPLYGFVATNAPGIGAMIVQWTLFAFMLIMYTIGLLSVILLLKGLLLLLIGKTKSARGTKKLIVSIFVLYFILLGGMYGSMYLLYYYVLAPAGVDCKVTFDFIYAIVLGALLIVTIFICILYTVSFRDGLWFDEAKEMASMLRKPHEDPSFLSESIKTLKEREALESEDKPQKVQKVIIEKHEGSIPSNIKHVGGHEYSGNQHLKIANIPEGLKTIGVGGFSNCLRLEVVSLPKSLKEIEANAFFNCKSLKRINYAGSKYEWAKIKRGSNWLSQAGTSVVTCADGAIAVDPLK